jgi:hypothetical protein
VRIVKASDRRKQTRGDEIVERLRRARGRISMTTDEIMALTRGEA